MKIIIKGLKFVANYILDKVKSHSYDDLSKLIKENNFKTYVEVGVWKGKTLFEVAKRNKDVKIHGIDEYKQYCRGDVPTLSVSRIYNKIKKEVVKESLGFPNVFIVTDPSLSAVKEFGNDSLDIVFIDASHDYKSVCEDIKAWMPKVRKGGILCGHDFGFTHFSVVKAVGDMIGFDNIEVKCGTTIWIYRK